MIIGVASADYLRADKSSTGVEQWGGAGWARIGQYLPHWRAAGHTVVAGTLWKDMNLLKIENAGEKVTPDIVLIQRIMHDGVADSIKLARESGQVVVNDLDDWYWGLDPNNQAFQASHPKSKHKKKNLIGQVYEVDNPEQVNYYSKNIAAGNLLTVSTPYLADRMAHRVRCPIEVVPNTVDVARFTPVTQTLIGTPLFGWTGSTSHRSGDIETVAGVLRPRILDGSIRFHHSGDNPRGRSLSDMLGVPRDALTYLPMCTATDYPALLKFDVGIVPLRDTPFNHAKSEIKGLEYAAAGIPFIAQATESYTRLHQEWDGAFWLARRPKDWIAGIKHYMSYENRVAAQTRLLDLVKTRDIHYGAAQMLGVLERLVRK